MFESHSFDHLQSTNQQAFAAARLTFWFFSYQDFKGIYKSTENNDYMFECSSLHHLKSTNQQAFGAATLSFWVYQYLRF